jgi:hypothetical protein
LKKRLTYGAPYYIIITGGEIRDEQEKQKKKELKKNRENYNSYNKSPGWNWRIHDRTIKPYKFSQIGVRGESPEPFKNYYSSSSII